jgi:4-phytase / acid phosphatase
MTSTILRTAFLLLASFPLGCCALGAQQLQAAGEQLQFAVYLSRHGVRSPTGKPEQYNPYSALPWPRWSVPPGYLTEHGYRLMVLFGQYDRGILAAQGLLAPSGCDDRVRVTIIADSDERTRETGKAVAEGMFPACAPEVHARTEGTDDPLFHPSNPPIGPQDRALALAAVKGRIGDDPAGLTEVYRTELEALDKILAGCGPNQNPIRKTLLDIPSSLTPGKGDRPVELHGPLSLASTLSENLLLEYTEGFQGAGLAWGCMDEAALRGAMQLHAAAAEYAQRTPEISRLYAENLLNAIVKSMDQSVGNKPVAGALGKPGDRVLFLVGHDTNIAAVAGTLGLNWIVDGLRDDTPPGGALIFELWHSNDGAYRVRLAYTAQTLQQMRETQSLTPDSRPARVQLFVPGCSRADDSCTWNGFSALVAHTLEQN